MGIKKISKLLNGVSINLNQKVDKCVKIFSKEYDCNQLFLKIY